MLSFAQFIIELDEKEDSYLDIGHTDQPYHLWIYNDGKFQKSKRYAANSSTGHAEKFPHQWHYNKTYSGRYEPETGKVSIHRPSSNKFGDIPSHIHSHLFKAFPKISSVHEYS